MVTQVTTKTSQESIRIFISELERWFSQRVNTCEHNLAAEVAQLKSICSTIGQAHQILNEGKPGDFISWKKANALCQEIGIQLNTLMFRQSNLDQQQGITFVNPALQDHVEALETMHQSLVLRLIAQPLIGLSS